jgi:hypothetical protein
MPKRINTPPDWLTCPRDRAEWIRLYRSNRTNQRVTPEESAFGASLCFDEDKAREDRAARLGKLPDDLRI